jgi:uncharacterized protein
MRQSNPAVSPGDNPEISRILEGLPKTGVIAIILFGSAATGKVRPLSDLDVCILTRGGIPIADKEVILSCSSRTTHISLFSDLPPAVQFRVFRDGKVLYCADPLALHRARVATIRAYCSMRPLIERHVTRVLG